MSVTVLLVDGPSRDETIKVESPYVSDVFVPVLREVNIFAFTRDEDGMLAPNIEAAHYKITRIKMFGQFLLVGSVTERPSDDDLFIALGSDRAKAAVII